MDLPKKVADRVRAAMLAAAARVFKENSIDSTPTKIATTWNVNNDLGLGYTFHLTEEKQEEK